MDLQIDLQYEDVDLDEIAVVETGGNPYAIEVGPLLVSLSYQQFEALYLAMRPYFVPDESDGAILKGDEADA